jgi:hypothetical protein
MRIETGEPLPQILAYMFYLSIFNYKERSLTYVSEITPSPKLETPKIGYVVQIRRQYNSHKR